jgi:hypothetical protein
MSLSVEALLKMSDTELVGAYYETRGRFVEQKFARDTQRARLDWLRAKAFATSSGGVSERRNAVDLSEELARKGQELREMTRDLDLLRADVDLLLMMVRSRGTLGASDIRPDDSDGEERREHGA